MRTHHQLSIGPVEVQPVVPARTTEGTSHGQALVRHGATGLSLLIEAVGETCSDKEAYLALGLSDAPYWSKVKSGEKPAPRVDRLTDLPLETQREYVVRWGQQLGMKVSTEDSRTRVLAELVECAAKALREIA
jgi:hypothetical protein